MAVPLLSFDKLRINFPENVEGKARKLYMSFFSRARTVFCGILPHTSFLRKIKKDFFMEEKIKVIARKLINPLLIIGIAVIFRSLPHPPNVAPIAAMALFGGAYLNKRYALVVPLIAMILSDLFIGLHNTVIFVYGSFLLTGLIGIWLKTHKNKLTIIMASFASSLIFFIITNFGVWLMYDFYAKTLTGLIDCYIAAIPFFRNTIVGDLGFTIVFFGSYELLLKMQSQTYVKDLHKNRG